MNVSILKKSSPFIVSLRKRTKGSTMLVDAVFENVQFSFDRRKAFFYVKSCNVERTMQEFTTSIEIYHPYRKYEFPINHIVHNSPRQPPLKKITATHRSRGRKRKQKMEERKARFKWKKKTRNHIL